MLFRLGRYWRMSPLVFSLRPRSQGWYGLAAMDPHHVGGLLAIRNA
jgi:hypothetical protein